MAARYSEIEEYIMNKIHTGEWPIGYKIPKEVELCEQFGVSRSTVRTAMLRMVQDGHLKRVKRKRYLCYSTTRIGGYDGIY